ncbi:MAG: FAD-dependent oxidoreductase [Candidatus Saccharimonas aalborgensis]
MMTDETIHDVVMIGAGPSALAAAIYTTREDIETVLYEKAVVGGLAAITDKVDNYPGFPDGIEGLTLADNLQKQAERFGAVIKYGDVSAVRRGQDGIVLTVDGEEVKAQSVLIATGSDYNKLGIPGEAEYYGRGVHYCATCDGAFYRDRRLVVVGGGNSGVQEAIFLTRFASHIDLLVRSTVKASQVLQDELQKYVDAGKVTIHLQTVPTEISVDSETKAMTVRTVSAGQSDELRVDGTFVFIGLKPNTEFLVGSGVQLDPIGHIITNEHLETAVPGIFASGDVRSGATMQVASAVGEGATAALNIREYLDDNRSE